MTRALSCFTAPFSTCLIFYPYSILTTQAQAAFAIGVGSDEPVVAERTMYFVMPRGYCDTDGGGVNNRGNEAEI